MDAIFVWLLVIVLLTGGLTVLAARRGRRGAQNPPEGHYGEPLVHAARAAATQDNKSAAW